MIQVHLLKRRKRKVKVDLKLGGQWKEKEKVLCLVANGRKRKRFFAWWPMEGEREGSHAWWPMEGERKILFTFSHFPPNQFT